MVSLLKAKKLIVLSLSSDIAPERLQSVKEAKIKYYLGRARIRTGVAGMSKYQNPE